MQSFSEAHPAIPPRKLNRYFGATGPFAYQRDPRFSYLLYVPRSHETAAPVGGYPLVVLVHGTNRAVERERAAFIDFAKRDQCIVMLPLFPIGISSPLDLDEYKRIEHQGVRYDEVLLGMVDEVRSNYNVRAGRFLLHGFSGGAQFVHRFFYLHPDRLQAVSIGAPGTVTFVDPESPWWVGTADAEERFGRPVHSGDLVQVPVLLVIGELDNTDREVEIGPSEPAWMPGVNDSGFNRHERLRALAGNLRSLGVSVEMAVVPGVGHHSVDTLGPVQEFFSRQIAADRTSPALSPAKT